MDSIVAALGANGLVLAALTYLIKTIISQRLNKELLEFKQTVESATQREIESYKANLEKERLRLQISYGGIFEKQAETVLSLYKNILLLEQAGSEAVHTGGSITERKQNFYQAWSEIKRSYNEQRILLSEDIDLMVKHFMESMYRSVFAVANVEARDFSRVPEDEFNKLTARQDKAFEIIETELPALREKLIEKMRHLFGVASSEL
jgi:hypothetical protein